MDKLQGKDHSLVSNNELLEDIEFTTQEYKAYKKLCEGFLILSNLPDISTVKSRELFNKSLHYYSMAKSSGERLLFLYEVKKERNI
jgi:hypothetical protein